MIRRVKEHMELRTVFLQRLHSLRKGSGETQVQVANAIGVSPRYYQKLDAGENLPGLEAFCALADHFGVSLDYLAGRAQEKEPRP